MQTENCEKLIPNCDDFERKGAVECKQYTNLADCVDSHLKCRYMGSISHLFLNFDTFSQQQEFYAKKVSQFKYKAKVIKENLNSATFSSPQVPVEPEQQKYGICVSNDINGFHASDK